MTTTDHTIPVLRKALAVLHAVASSDGPTSTKAIASTLGYSPSTTYRILRTYLAENWLRPAEQGGHKLSFGLLPIVEPLVMPEVVAKAAQKPLREIAGQTGLLAKLSVRDDDQAVTVCRAGKPPPGGAVGSGDSTPLVVGAAGAALLSGLPAGSRRELITRAPRECWRRQQPGDVLRRINAVAARGYCVDVGGFHPALAALAAPLSDSRGRVLGALSIVGPARVVEAGADGLAEQLVAAAARCRSLLTKSVPFSHDLES